MLTIFSIPKDFEGCIGVIQHNAIASWRALDPDLEIILFGNEEGTHGLARELSLRHHPEVARNRYGTPLVNSLFAEAARLASNSILCYVNADIILMSDFMRTLEAVRELRPFLMVGRRTDLDVSRPLDFSSLDWEKDLRMRAREEGKLRPPSWIDYFLFSRDLYLDDIPPFAVGRTAWDNWLIYYARRKRATVVDATSAVLALHQNHGYKAGVITRNEDGSWEGPEIQSNREMAGRRAVNYNVDDATHVLVEGHLSRRKVVVRARRFTVTRFPAAARAVVKVARRSGIYGDEKR